MKKLSLFLFISLFATLTNAQGAGSILICPKNPPAEPIKGCFYKDKFKYFPKNLPNANLKEFRKNNYKRKENAAMESIKIVLGGNNKGESRSAICHKNTVDEASFNRCISLPMDHDFKCGVPEMDGIYFQSSNGHCSSLSTVNANFGQSSKNSDHVDVTSPHRNKKRNYLNSSQKQENHDSPVESDSAPELESADSTEEHSPSGTMITLEK